SHHHHAVFRVDGEKKTSSGKAPARFRPVPEPLGGQVGRNERHDRPQDRSNAPHGHKKPQRAGIGCPRPKSRKAIAYVAKLRSPAHGSSAPSATSIWERDPAYVGLSPGCHIRPVAAIDDRRSTGVSVAPWR